MGTRFHASMEGVAAADAAFAVLDRESDPGAPVAEVRPRALPDGPPRISLEDVTVRYPGRDDPALEHVTLTIEPGERVALVGESGGGKSTLLHLLLGFLRPSEGRVLVDGTDLRELDLDGWRAGLAFVPQRPHLFTTTVADNIRLGAPTASPQEVRQAATAAHAHDFIDELPQGYETQVGERGANLSAGQRQRIALARAFCRPAAPILLLDEPTARLDGRSEAAVVAATAGLCHGRTAVIVAHRPAMIELADRVIRLHEGRVIADTTARRLAGTDVDTANRPYTHDPDEPGMNPHQDEPAAATHHPAHGADEHEPPAMTPRRGPTSARSEP
jgi:ATP-binding cassette subfamily C protein/ATP-binding cassette subfamily C protein CydD